MNNAIDTAMCEEEKNNMSQKFKENGINISQVPEETLNKLVAECVELINSWEGENCKSKCQENDLSELLNQIRYLDVEKDIIIARKKGGNCSPPLYNWKPINYKFK